MKSLFSLFLFRWLISCFILLWSEKVLEITLILLNLLTFVLGPSMWSVIENIPCALEKTILGFLFFVFFILGFLDKMS